MGAKSKKKEPVETSKVVMQKPGGGRKWKAECLAHKWDAPPGMVWQAEINQTSGRSAPYLDSFRFKLYRRVLGRCARLRRELPHEIANIRFWLFDGTQNKLGKHYNTWHFCTDCYSCHYLEDAHGTDRPRPRTP